jgi:phosphatidylglycerophosphatase A
MYAPHPIPSSVSKYAFFYLIVTWFHAGRLRPASGTWGTMGAIPVIYMASWGGQAALAALALMAVLGGLWAIGRFMRHTDKTDPSEIVIDEVAGMAVTALFLPYDAGVLAWVFAFFAFRIFDAVKRGPVGWCDTHVKGAWGVMADDLVAGLLAGLVTLLVF